MHTPFLILGVWLLGGALALLGAFIWAELATRLPGAGGQYLYLREAYHPSVAFIYGWVLLLVTQTGGMAAVAVTFGRYYREITGSPAGDGPIAAVTLHGFDRDQLLWRARRQQRAKRPDAAQGRRHRRHGRGGNRCGAAERCTSLPLLDRPVSLGLWQRHWRGHDSRRLRLWRMADRELCGRRDARSTARSVPRPGDGRDRRRGAVSCGQFCLPARARSGRTGRDPHSRIRGDAAALGERGAQWIAFGIAISTLGFLSQGILTAPRVYYAMARDGLFFKSVGWLSPRTGVPVVAIVLQGVTATVIALSGRYEQILNYVISVDFISFGLTAASLFVFRRKRSGRRRRTLYDARATPTPPALFVLACAAIVITTIATFPANSAIGLIILLAGIPVYLYWSRRC